MTRRGRRLGAVLAVIVSSVVPLALPACGGSMTKAATCENVQVTELLHDFDVIELAVAAGTSVPADRSVAYRKMADAVIACAKPGARITVRPITEHALTELPIIADTVPDTTGENAWNDQHYASDRQAYLARTKMSVDGLSSIGMNDHGSDPLGALLAASRNVQPQSRALLLLVCNGWQQTRELNVFAYRQDPARYASEALANLTSHRALPDLSGVRVIVAGITTGDPRIQVTNTQLGGLCEFWRIVVEKAHGEMRQGDCTPSLTGTTR